MIHIIKFGNRADPNHRLFSKLVDIVRNKTGGVYRKDIDIILKKYNGRFAENDNYVTGFEFDTEQDYLMFKLCIG